jgi:hypothetical protein
MNYKNFYQQIGNLLYAFSAIDGTIRPKEISKIKEIVKNKLTPIENSEDEFGTDAAYLAEFQFDFCCENAEDPKEAYKTFINWFRDNSATVGDNYRDLIFRIAAGVAASFNGINKSELILLETLRRDLAFDKAEK